MVRLAEIVHLRVDDDRPADHAARSVQRHDRVRVGRFRDAVLVRGNVTEIADVTHLIVRGPVADLQKSVRATTCQCEIG